VAALIGQPNLRFLQRLKLREQISPGNRHQCQMIERGTSAGLVLVSDAGNLFFTPALARQVQISTANHGNVLVCRPRGSSSGMEAGLIWRKYISVGSAVVSMERQIWCSCEHKSSKYPRS
jgi:hypothetical protein